MIQQAHIDHWRTQAPWPSDAHVEQDLVLSRCLVELFTQPLIAKSMALRGGTALSKLFLKQFGRYSEDIDLVQIVSSDNGPFIDAIRCCIDPILGSPSRKIGEGITTLTYKFVATDTTPLKLKIETNTREHQNVLEIQNLSYEINSPWFKGSSIIKCYALEELLGTKLRALYQRKKGRDLYDFWAVANEHQLDGKKIVECFKHYMPMSGNRLNKKDFVDNIKTKMKDGVFLSDMKSLLRPGIFYNANDAFKWVEENIFKNFGGAK